MKFLINKGTIFYACYNIRLFFLLLFSKADVFHSNDLDTLLPNYLVSKIRNKPLVYDSHELFTEVPELANRKFVRECWLRIEKFIFPKLRYIFTVNESIANIYNEKYKVKLEILHNYPIKRSFAKTKTRSELGLPQDEKIIILQGAGINIDRGAEELVEAMKYLENTTLVIAGGGDVVAYLKKYVKDNNLKNKIIFFKKMPYDELIQLTSLADCGITLDKNTNLNYLYSLPNKIFDYIMAGIPVLSSDLPEIRKIFEKYNIGILVENHNPEHIALKIKELLFNYPDNYWNKNIEKASDELCWENEEEKLIKVYNKILE